MFIDYCMLNMDQIISDENVEALAVLLKLMSVGLKSQGQLLEDRYDDRVRARFQHGFWRDFLIKLQELDSYGQKMQKMQAFKDVFLELIQRIIQHMSVKTSDLFLEFNKTEVKDEQFDEYFNNKHDLGQVMRELIRLLTVPEIIQVLNKQLEDGLALAQANPNNIVALVNLHGIFTALE